MRESVFIYHWDCIAGRLAKSLCSEKLKTVIRAKIIRSVGVLYSSLCSLALLLSFCLSSSLSLSVIQCLCHTLSSVSALFVVLWVFFH